MFPSILNIKYHNLTCGFRWRVTLFTSNSACPEIEIMWKQSVTY
jgi:hypothetical protein